MLPPPAWTSGTKLYTAQDLASQFQVDLKTIHNWTDKARLGFFRTPGRHLRFRAKDVYDFMMRYGYPVPETL